MKQGGARTKKSVPVSISLSIARMKHVFGPPDVHQITRTSLPVSVYVDRRESERVLGPHKHPFDKEETERSDASEYIP